MLLFLTQKQTISSGKSDFLSSLVKLKDALQAQSKDHKKAAIKEVSKIKISLEIYLFLFSESCVFSGHLLLSGHRRP